MAVDYSRFFGIVKLYTGSISIYKGFKTTRDVVLLHEQDILSSDVDDANENRDLINQDISGKNGFFSQQDAYGSLLGQYLTTDGRNEIQSSSSTSETIAADLVQFMTRDSETVLTNIISNSITYSRSGDGVVSTFTQGQMTRNDVITLSCTTAQNGGDATFSVSSQLEGNLSKTVTADGVTSYDDDYFGVKLGITGLIVGVGSGGNFWAVSDKIIITTTSDERSHIFVSFRDLFSVELPTSATPTISNLFVENAETFPGSPEDGQEVVIDGIKYYYDDVTEGWVESCI